MEKTDKAVSENDKNLHGINERDNIFPKVEAQVFTNGLFIEWNEEAFSFAKLHKEDKPADVTDVPDCPGAGPPSLWTSSSEKFFRTEFDNCGRFRLSNGISGAILNIQRIQGGSCHA